MIPLHLAQIKEYQGQQPVMAACGVHQERKSLHTSAGIPVKYSRGRNRFGGTSDRLSFRRSEDLPIELLL